MIICDRACKNRSSERKNRRFLACLLYHNLITIYTIATKSLSLLQNLKAFFCTLRKWHSTFGTKDISENISRCNLRSYGRFRRPVTGILVRENSNSCFDPRFELIYLFVHHIAFYNRFLTK